MLLTTVEIGAISYLAICMSLLKWQNRLIFSPSSTIQVTPTQLGLSYEEIWLRVSETEHLNGWWISSPFPKRGVLLYLHGNGDNIGGNITHAQLFQQLGWDVFLIDYRGYGRSKGKFPSEARVYHDAQIAWDYLREQKGIQPQDIFIYGHSLGGAIAIELAVRNPQAAGLIVESSFTSIRNMVNFRSIYRIFPIELILHQRFDSLSKIESLQMPLLLIHGIEDRIVPARMSQTLYDAATVPKKLLLVPYANHNNVASVSGEEYLQTWLDFYQLVRTNQRELAGR